MRVYRRVKTSVRGRILSLACLRSRRQVAPLEGARLTATLDPEDGNFGATPSPKDMSREVPSAPPSPPETMDPPSAPEAEGAPSPETVVTSINATPTMDQDLSLESMKASPRMTGDDNIWRAAASEGAATMIQKNVRGNQARRRSSLRVKPSALSHQLHQVVQAEIKVEKKRKVTPAPTLRHRHLPCLSDLPQHDLLPPR